MAHPKRRQSHTRQAKRRTHDVAKMPALAICPNCGAKLVIRRSKRGRFYGCSNYPKCDYIESIKKTDKNETN